MLETRALFIGFERVLGEVASTWHPHGCHKGDTWAKGTSHEKVNISLLDESDGLRFAHTCVRNLGERKGGQVCKSIRV